jgi:hypothetical protein
MYFHVIKDPVADFGKSLLVDLKNLKHFQFAGSMKNAMTTKMAGVASLTFLY